MEQKPIYLCYTYPCYIVSYFGVRLEYIGEYYPDCVAQMAKEYNLSKEECDQLRDNAEVYVQHLDTRIVIEEQTLNAFCI